MKLDILAFGVHPDDIELCCSGTLLVEISNGKAVGIVDLTEGELGTRGSAETRKQEAADSARIMGVTLRENIGLKDGFFQIDEDSLRQVIVRIRKYQPEIILCNAPEDRHPDHARAASLVSEAAFLSGLRKIQTEFEGKVQEAWRPKYVFNYIQDRDLKPDFIIDVSRVFEKKIEAIQAFKTQFFNPADKSSDPQTYISTPSFLQSIIGRSVSMGKQIGVEHGEGFISKKVPGFANFDSFIKITT